jgi:hypothetical protein
MSFHLISLQLGGEHEMLDRALEALANVESGETAFLPEYLAWTPHGSGRAFARLIGFAQAQGINIVTTLNLAGDLVEDLPGNRQGERYNAVAVFTRYGVAHVPQAKIATQSYESDKSLAGAGIGVSPYDRTNRIQLDVDEQLITARFLIGSDVMALHALSPRDLACDLLVVVGNLAHGAEVHASCLLGRALEAGVARTALHVNAFDAPPTRGRQPLAIKVEEVLDATRTRKPALRWPHPRAIRNAFHIYEDKRVRDFASMARLPRRGRVAVPRSRWVAPIRTAEYPVTIVL